MLYGISGASGTGKTTLAKRVAEDLGITYMPTSITECAKKHGFDAVGMLTLPKRLELQLHLLEDHVEMICQAERPLIVDRTPIDMIGYMLAELDMHSHHRLTDKEIGQVEDYVNLCSDMTLKLYDYVFIVGQLDNYDVSATRPADNRAYQTHSQMIMLGALFRLSGQVSFAHVPMQDLDRRCEFVHDTIVGRLDAIGKERRSSLHIH
jgi:hypothetical protein